MLAEMSVTVFSQSDYYIRKAQGYQREAEYCRKKADGYRREATYYLKKPKAINGRLPTIPGKVILTGPGPIPVMLKTRWTDTRRNCVMRPGRMKEPRCISMHWKKRSVARAVLCIPYSFVRGNAMTAILIEFAE